MIDNLASGEYLEEVGARLSEQYKAVLEAGMTHIIDNYGRHSYRYVMNEIEKTWRPGDLRVPWWILPKGRVDSDDELSFERDPNYVGEHRK